MSKEINEAMAEVEEQRSVKEKLQQQYDSLRGQYTHREEQNKRKIASLSRDLKEESRQLKAALAEGDELRDAASQLHAARAPQPLAACRLPSPQPAPHRVPCLRPLGRTRRPSTSRSAGTPPASRDMRYMFYVRCLPAPCAPQPALSHAPSPPACCARTTTARRVPPPSPQPAPHRVPRLRPLGRTRGLQPAAQLGHLPRHEHVRACFTCAASPRPAPPNLLCHTRPSPCMLRAHHNRSPRAASHSPQPAPHRVPRLRPLGSTRRPSTSRSAGTPPASRTCTACFTCAASPRPCAPQPALSHAPSPPACCARTATARRVPPPTARSPPRTVCPACDPSAVRGGLQPAAQLGHLPRHEHVRACFTCAAPRPRASQICMGAMNLAQRCGRIRDSPVTRDASCLSRARSCGGIGVAQMLRQQAQGRGRGGGGGAAQARGSPGGMPCSGCARCCSCGGGWRARAHRLAPGAGVAGGWFARCGCRVTAALANARGVCAPCRCGGSSRLDGASRWTRGFVEAAVEEDEAYGSPPFALEMHFLW